MYGVEASGAETERTAFRRAEKRYKLYKSQPPRSRKQPVVNRTDLSDVIDFLAVLESFERDGGTPEGIYRFVCPGFALPIFCLKDRPGFYFIPCALTIEEQCYWIRQSLISFPQPPNRTNHTAIYGPISDLLTAVQNKKILVEAENSNASLVDNNMLAPRYIFSETSLDAHVEGHDSCKSVSASVLLRKLRWSTLGLQFDWSKRNYDVSLPHNKIPNDLCLLAKKMAVPAMSSGEEFQPEAAIVNYFSPSDMLGGHLDDMEADWSKPIPGVQSYFSSWGKSREDMPVSMFLRSGDIILMAGQARECFHGVPRIFIDDEHAENSDLLSQFSGEDDRCFMDYIKSSRININIRQVN